MADKYDFLRIVGKGSFGKAWLVKSKVSQRQYVLKEIQVCNMSEKDRNQAVNEVAILARLKHKNIVRYREAFVATGTLNIVMAYADGGDLSHRIHQARSSGISLAEPQIMGWFVQITFALTYIHDLKILHRDLKPQNIFLTRDDVVKLGDFGIARTLRNTQDRASTAIGTPYYLSPEICRRQPYNHKSDIWATGCVLYELLTLNHPFEADDFSFLVLKILRGKYKDIPSTYGPLPGDLVAVLLRVNPDRRPSTEQILSIPSLRRYVLEYTSRSRNSSKISRSSCQSTTSTSEDQELVLGDQVITSAMSGDKCLKDNIRGANAQEDDVFLSASTRNNSSRQPNASACSSNVVGNCDRHASSRKSNETTVNVKYTPDVENGSDISKQHPSYRQDQSVDTVSLQKKIRRQNCQKRPRVGNCSLERADHKKTFVGEKLRTKSSSDAEQNVDSLRLKEKDVEDVGLFTKEGIKTVKRRKYSCMTPVASKKVRGFGTPCSATFENGKRLAPKIQYAEGTPPVVRLFGKQPEKNGIALNDGWSPVAHLSPRFKTRVINKGSLMQDCSSKDRCKKHGELKQNTKKTVPSIEKNKTQDTQESIEPPTSRKQSTTCIQENHAIAKQGAESTISGENEKIHELGPESVAVSQNEQHRDAQTSVIKTGPDIPSSEFREVCEMLLACTPSISKSGPDKRARLELLKIFLERKLGSKTAVMAYGLIERLVREGKAADDVIGEVQRILSPDRAVYTSLLIQVRGLEVWCMES